MARILTVKEVAEKLHVKPLTVREYLRKGKIPGRKLGKSWRVVESELEQSLTTGRADQRVSARGVLSDVPGLSSEAFMQEKHEETEDEERKRESRQGEAA